MNNLEYKILNKKLNLESSNQEEIDTLYNFYKRGSQILNYDINIKKNEFQSIFEWIYNVLLLRISKEECYIVSEHYLKLLMHDQIDGDWVDARWFIEHLWYLYVGIANEVDGSKYKDCIPFLQTQLMKQFGIEESFSEKISRKLSVRMLIK